MNTTFDNTPIYAAIADRPIGLVVSRHLGWSGSKRGFFPRPIGSASWPQRV